jgi:hypothetical protein
LRRTIRHKHKTTETGLGSGQFKQKRIEAGLAAMPDKMLEQMAAESENLAARPQKTKH